MFAKHTPSDPAPQPSAAELARILGGGLVQIIVSNLQPLVFHLFLNHHLVEQTDVEEVSVLVELPEEDGQPMLRATMTHAVTNVAGERQMQSAELFPCTLEVVAENRRFSITCSDVADINSAWIGIGLLPDGSAHDLSGVRSLRMVLAAGILDARVTWTNGQEEELFPAP
ncbi:MAG: hypothetical protein KGJ62_08250 [Armatimonadetes bacterium]|nr:hypothetical protein [Armatimonadota bacterium]MDE2205268.1 hypothetical protein [Armatimonadota bacterium]